MPSDPEKAYAKKHKLNDLLNELYLELTTSKPDNPIEHAIKHLESKLPPTIITHESNENGQQLLGKLFNKMELGDGNENVSSSKLNVSNAISPFATFNIMNKINRVIVKTNNQLTPEEILEKEIIVNKREDNEGDTQVETKAMVRYKNDLKNRQNISKHKNDLKQLVEKQLGVNEDFLVKDAEEIKQKGYEEELEGEILTSDNYYRVADKKKTKKKNNLRTLNDSQARAIVSPFVKFIICQFCARIQQQGIVDNSKNNEQLVKEQSQLEASNEVKEQTLQESVIKQEEPVIQENVQVEKTIFDFFSKSLEPKLENLDDEIIESASQVSGPRKIEPFEAITNRSEPPQKEENAAESDKDPDILAWILSNQLKSEQKPIDSKSELTLVDSKTSTKKEPIVVKKSSRANSVLSALSKKSASNLSARSDKNDSSKQNWRANSNSDLSGVNKK